MLRIAEFYKNVLWC